MHLAQGNGALTRWRHSDPCRSRAGVGSRSHERKQLRATAPVGHLHVSPATERPALVEGIVRFRSIAPERFANAARSICNVGGAPNRGAPVLPEAAGLDAAAKTEAAAAGLVQHLASQFPEGESRRGRSSHVARLSAGVARRRAPSDGGGLTLPVGTRAPRAAQRGARTPNTPPLAVD